MRLLKEILEAWKAEVERKPSGISMEEALDILKLEQGKE